MKIITCFLLVVNCLLPVLSKSQDIHFSQFEASPLTLNPALAGVMDLNYRIANNYKNQWTSIATPYSTMAFAYDMNLLKDRGKSTYLGLGLSAFSNKAGKSELANSQFNFSVSATTNLNERNTFSVGFQAGYGQRSVNFSSLSWDNQFDGNNFDPTLPSREISYSDKINYADISTGGLWNFRDRDQLNISIGAAYFHANKPNQSFNNVAKDVLQPKLILHNATEIKLPNSGGTPDRYFIPKILFMKQGPHQELFLGAFFKTVIQTSSRYTNWQRDVTLDLGVFYRKGDAIIAATSFDYGNIRIGISYDINISKLRTASSYNGGIEYSLIYKGLFSTDKINVRGLPRAK